MLQAAENEDSFLTRILQLAAWPGQHLDVEFQRRSTNPLHKLLELLGLLALVVEEVVQVMVDVMVDVMHPHNPHNLNQWYSPDLILKLHILETKVHIGGSFYLTVHSQKPSEFNRKYHPHKVKEVNVKSRSLQ